MPVRYEIVTGGLVNPTASGGSNPSPATPSGQMPIVDFKVELPDTFAGQSLNYSGFISPAPAAGGLSAAIAITGTITLPAVPGGGLSLNWIIEINFLTGVAQAKAGTAATTGTQTTPAPDANNIGMFTHTITNGDTVPWARAPTLTDLNP